MSMIPKETGLSFGQEGQKLNSYHNSVQRGIYIACKLHVAGRLPYALPTVTFKFRCKPIPRTIVSYNSSGDKPVS
jgi:hypothetical protein